MCPTRQTSQFPDWLLPGPGIATTSPARRIVPIRSQHPLRPGSGRTTRIPRAPPPCAGGSSGTSAGRGQPHRGGAARVGGLVAGAERREPAVSVFTRCRCGAAWVRSTWLGVHLGRAHDVPVEVEGRRRSSCRDREREVVATGGPSTGGPDRSTRCGHRGCPCRRPGRSCPLRRARPCRNCRSVARWNSVCPSGV